MKLTLTNNLIHPVPIMSAQGDGFATELLPSDPYTLDGPWTVAIIGNKPSVTEQIQEGLAIIAETAARIVSAWQARNNQMSEAGDVTLDVTVQNDGDSAVRVILGDGVHDTDVAPGDRADVRAWSYLELRELGHVDNPLDQQPSSAA